MASATVVAGPYNHSTNVNMVPNTAVVGGDGSVDDESDATYVVMRVQQLGPILGARKSSFFWDTATMLPEYAGVRNPTLDFTVRAQHIDPPADTTTFIFQLGFAGVTAPFVGRNMFVDVGGWQDLTSEDATVPGPFTVSEALWDDIRGGNMNLSAAFIHPDGSDLTNPVTGDPYPLWTQVQVAISRIRVTISWTYPTPVDPARLLWPRTDDAGFSTGRLWPPPISPQTTGRLGSAAPY